MSSKAKTNDYLIKVNHYIDTYQDRMIADLREMVAIRSVSGSFEHHSEIGRMVKWIEAYLRRLKATTCERFDIGSYVVDGKSIKLPTVILASFGRDAKKKTVLVYARYDVKNAKRDEWTSDPWDVTLQGGILRGRGTCKSKMPLLSWLHAVEAHLMQKIPLPVNLKFIIEGMSEMNCFGLEDFLFTQRITFMRGIDFVHVNKSEWLNSTIPCISYGTCGICQFALVCGGESEQFDANDVQTFLFDSFVDGAGNIRIPNINDDTVQINPEIEQSLERVQCDLDVIKKNLPPVMQSWSKQKILLRLWQMPQLISGPLEQVSCICGGGGGADGAGDSNDANDAGDRNGGDGGGGGGGSGGSAVSRKFVLKIVPVQTPERCARAIMEHIVNLMRQKFDTAQQFVVESKYSKKGRRMECRIRRQGGDSANVGYVMCTMISETRAWQEDSVSPHYEATKRATARVYKDPASLIKESIDSPIILILDKVRSAMINDSDYD